MISSNPSTRLIKHIIRSYARLAENSRVRSILKDNLPPVLKDKNFYQSLDESSKRWLQNLLKSIAAISGGNERSTIGVINGLGGNVSNLNNLGGNSMNHIGNMNSMGNIGNVSNMSGLNNMNNLGQMSGFNNFNSMNNYDMNSANNGFLYGNTYNDYLESSNMGALNNQSNSNKNNFLGSNSKNFGNMNSNVFAYKHNK
jgi:hypothetical protein